MSLKHSARPVGTDCEVMIENVCANIASYSGGVIAPTRRRRRCSRRTTMLLLSCVSGLIVLASYTVLSESVDFRPVPDGHSAGNRERDPPTIEDKRSPVISHMYDNLVCLTAITDSQFVAAKEMFSSIHLCLPDTKIIVYDLGLDYKNIEQLRYFTYVELHAFPFLNYSHLPHVRDLNTYAWKPIIIDMVSEWYDVIMYSDPTLRMKSCNMTSALEHLLKFPLLNIHPTPHRAIEFTHDGMIKYFQYPKARIDMAGVHTLDGSVWLMWANLPLKEKVLAPWLDCALHQECLAPEGAYPWSCWFTSKHDGHYIGCHRYDQSAMTLTLAREFGLDFESKACNRTITDQLWVIKKV